jgi:hypothetical protein
MTLQEAVTQLVEAVLPHVEQGVAGSLADHVHAYLWPFVATGVELAVANGVYTPPADTPTPPEVQDKRVKRWRHRFYFWKISPIGHDLIAETDPEIMEGTGTLPDIVERYGLELHGADAFPEELSIDATKARLPQLRNNLGRQGSAVLRIEYAVGDDRWLCQVDVIRLSE